jgi:uncharacterized protein (UPF0332 family)
MSPEASSEEPVDLVKINPDPSRAISAVMVAEELLESAKEKFRERKRDEALEDVKNAIRMASSAMLYYDGYVARTLDTTCYYLQNHYPEKFPTNEWRIIEVGTKTGVRIIDTVLDKLGLKKKEESRVDEVGRAIAIATVFVQSVKLIIMGGERPSVERAVREE